MKKVVLVAPVLTQSGYGVHSRQVARWLLSKDNIDLKIIPVPWGDTPWLLNPDLYNGLIGQMMKKTAPLEQANGADVTIQLQLPNEWNPQLGRVNVGITAGVETDLCNPEWVKCCNQMTTVIVPSKHTKDTLTRSGKLEKEAVVIPESYPDSIRESTPEIELNLETENNFLIVAQLTGSNPFSDRKNIFFAIKWLCEAFSDRPDVGIVLKTNLGRNTAIDKKTLTNIMTQLLKEVRGNKTFPKLHIIHGSMSDQEIVSLYRHPKIKCLVSLTRGEGFGLPLLEAASCELPIIATNWSAHTEFLSTGKFISIDYKLEEIHPSRVDENIFVKGAKWAMPLEDDFKKKVKKFIDSQSIPKEWALELKNKLINSHSQDSINTLYDAALGDYLC